MKNFYYLKTEPYNFEGLPDNFTYLQHGKHHPSLQEDL